MSNYKTLEEVEIAREFLNRLELAATDDRGLLDVIARRRQALDEQEVRIIKAGPSRASIAQAIYAEFYPHIEDNDLAVELSEKATDTILGLINRDR